MRATADDFTHIQAVNDFVNGKTIPNKTPHTGQTRYYNSPEGLDPTPLKVVGVLPGCSEWVLLAKPSGQLTLIAPSHLTRHATIVQRLFPLVEVLITAVFAVAFVWAGSSW